jgi:hypothetical protein
VRRRERPVGAAVGVGDLPLGRVLALAAEEEIALVERLADADVEQLVGLLVQQLVGAGGTRSAWRQRRFARLVSSIVT